MGIYCPFLRFFLVAFSEPAGSPRRFCLIVINGKASSHTPPTVLYRPRLLGLIHTERSTQTASKFWYRVSNLSWVGAATESSSMIRQYFIMLTGKHCRVHYAPNKAPRIPALSIDRRSTKSSVDWRNTTLNTELLLRSSSVLVVINNNNRRIFIWWTFCFAPWGKRGD